MKLIITGGAGHISKPLAEKLIAAGHQVTIVSRHVANLQPLVEKGGIAAIGSVEDPGFLVKTFAGADAVYTMVPPKFDPTGKLEDHIGQVGKNYAEAIRANNIKFVVNLSSIGAHLSKTVGPVNGLFKVEQSLNDLKEVNILHLRPGYFYDNLFGNISMIRDMNIIGGNFGGPGFKMVFASTSDIAEVAFEAMNNLNFSGHQVHYIASDERSTDDIAQLLGNAVGKPELSWVIFSDEQAKAGMIHAGIPEELARNYAEMGHAMGDGSMFEDYWNHHPKDSGIIKLENFANVFGAVYSQS